MAFTPKSTPEFHTKAPGPDGAGQRPPEAVPYRLPDKIGVQHQLAPLLRQPVNRRLAAFQELAGELTLDFTSSP